MQKSWVPSSGHIIWVLMHTSIQEVKSGRPEVEILISYKEFEVSLGCTGPCLNKGGEREREWAVVL